MKIRFASGEGEPIELEVNMEGKSIPRIMFFQGEFYVNEPVSGSEGLLFRQANIISFPFLEAEEVEMTDQE
jgi:hypothetical protein